MPVHSTRPTPRRGTVRTAHRETDVDAAERWITSLRADRIAAGPETAQVTAPDEPWRDDHGPRSPDHVICFATFGTTHATVGGERVVLGAGSVLWARPGISLRLWTRGEGDCVVQRLRLAHDPSVDVFAEPFLLAEGIWEAESLLPALAHELSDTPLGGLRDERVRGLLVILFTSVLRAANSGDVPGGLSRPARRLIVELADGRIHERLRAADLAEAVGLTPDYFTRVFRRTFGMPPREWLMHRRVRHGVWALDTSDRSVTQIAQTLGYPDAFLFSRQFKLIMGMSPQTYRRRRQPLTGARLRE
ncbi:helix-turn-helix transcriptional regulator [Streptomyces sp. NPDC047028]|uniref:helix-turn-helix domain-containing protein n=1 Tax=Streptomyces sp. NPDC047028 TaxID=3155793 RepID=UPI0033C8D846